MPTAEQVGIFVLVAIALIPALSQLAGWFGFKQRREVSFQAEFATAAELSDVKKDLTEEIERVDNDVQALRSSIVENGEKRRIAIESKVEDARREARTEAAALHEKVNKVDRAVAGVQTSQELQRQMLAQISAKLDRA
jgi:hypothetical protein